MPFRTDYFKDSISRGPGVSIFIGTLGHQMRSLTGQIPATCRRHHHHPVFFSPGVGSTFQVNKHYLAILMASSDPCYVYWGGKAAQA